MEGGYVLDFRNASFAEFFRLDFSIEIYDEQYDGHGDSKANRLRGFFQVAPDHIVGKVLHSMINICEGGLHAELIGPARLIADRLVQSSPVENLEELSLDFSDALLARYAESIRRSITGGSFSEAIDRMHSYMVLYLRGVCSARGIEFEKAEALHSVGGKYVKHLMQTGELETEMSITIFKSNLSILDRFSPVRNEGSMAHPNETIGEAEAEYILSSVLALLRFIRSVERKRTIKERRQAEWNVPF